jgi:heme-degrading monooxygenase HmoA
MHMQVVWGRILPGRWSAFEVAYREAIARRGEVRGLKDQWLLRDQNDPDAGYSISLWESEADMQAYWQSPGRAEGMALLQPFFSNQYTTTHCEVRMAARGT